MKNYELLKFPIFRKIIKYGLILAIYEQFQWFFWWI